MSLTKGLSIRLRIALGFFSILGLIVVLGVGTMWLGNTVRTSVTEMSDRADTSDVILAIGRDVARLQHADVLFFGVGDQEAATRVEDLHRQIEAALETARAALQDPAQLETIAQMQAHLVRHKEGSARLVELRQTREELISEALDGMGARITQRLSLILESNIGDATLDFVRSIALAADAVSGARLAARAFVAEPNEDRAAQAEGATTAARPSVVAIANASRSDEVREQVERLVRLFDQYNEKFEELVKVTAATDQLFRGQLTEAAEGLAESAQTLVRAQRQATIQIQDEVRGVLSVSDTATLIGLVVALVLGTLLTWLVGRSIATPVAQLTGQMSRLAEGELKVTIQHTERGDEIGAMARALEVFRHHAQEVERLTEQQYWEREQATVERRATLHRLAESFEASVQSVVETVTKTAGQMNDSAGTLLHTAETTTSLASDVETAADRVTESVHTVAAAAEELSASIREISSQVQSAAEVTNQAVNEAQMARRTMDALMAAAQRIGEVIDMINSIAGQTNLLALNATIEAARAGDAGRGFAVVANEVKTLASETAKATDDIQSQIAGIQAETKRAVEAITGILGTIENVNGITTAIASAIEEQGAATSEIARNVQQAAGSTAEVTSGISQVSQAAAETGRSANMMRRASSSLASQSETLRGEVHDFLEKVRVG